jgi:hypothetical protein
MDELTARLSDGTHEIAVGGPQPTLEELQRRIDELGYVFIKFTGTRGGTDLGVRLDRSSCDLSEADFDAGAGTAHLEGTLTLNDDPVRCIADIDLATLRGTGRLVVAETVEQA